MVKTVIILLLSLFIYYPALSQSSENSIIFEGVTVYFGMSEDEFKNLFPVYEKTENLYKFTEMIEEESSSFTVTVSFNNNVLTKFNISTHWPNREHFNKLEAVVNQLKTYKREEDEYGLMKYLKKADIKGYALYGENAAVELWDSRVIKDKDE